MILVKRERTACARCLHLRARARYAPRRLRAYRTRSTRTLLLALASPRASLPRAARARACAHRALLRGRGRRRHAFARGMAWRVAARRGKRQGDGGEYRGGDRLIIWREEIELE